MKSFDLGTFFLFHPPKIMISSNFNGQLKDLELEIESDIPIASKYRINIYRSDNEKGKMNSVKRVVSICLHGDKRKIYLGNLNKLNIGQNNMDLVTIDLYEPIIPNYYMIKTLALSDNDTILASSSVEFIEITE
ncbi:hypothetical protein [Marispirochaeta aestuarii]|uniref:hypothetical protein n=1 Tax=Marispirochaeta aestuarii TaxID=1963862 RepID=UPI001178B242|nr:hypothetical protein [Marispirochaeta aestuarii]